jgi:prepilin-type N-terminal cleavage/methylation domain-containing protein
MRRRHAFTLVELLVTIALVTFIMALLSEAFIIGLKTFRDLKSIGDMDERLRAALMQMQTDLKADHFGGDQRLSDPGFWNYPPSAGFFQINVQTFPAPFTGVRPPFTYQEGNDADFIPSAVVTDTVLHFTVKLRGNRPDRFFSATQLPGASPLLSQPATFVEAANGQLAPDARYQVGPGTSFNSQWAEITYFLLPNGDSAGSTPLYTLYRSQLVVAPDTANLNWPLNPPNPLVQVPIPATQINNYQEMCCVPWPIGGPFTQLYFYDPSDLTNLSSRAFDINNPTRSATFVLGDVISFEVKALSYTLGTLPSAAQFGYLSYDSGDQNNSQNTFVTALQITLRVWDAKTLQTRQITIVQEL